jgi:hypothetical protein
VSHTLWPCAICAAPGYRNLGTDGYCARHLADLYNAFDPAMFAVVGVGLPGRTAAIEDLTCCRCAATWVGVVGEPCGYCQVAYTHMLEWQAELVLSRPDVDPGDQRYQQIINAWAKRLAVAVKAHIITEDDARRALQREAKGTNDIAA